MANSKSILVESNKVLLNAMWEECIEISRSNTLPDRDKDTRLILADMLEDWQEEDPEYLPTGQALRWCVQEGKFPCSHHNAWPHPYPWQWYAEPYGSTDDYLESKLPQEVISRFHHRYRRYSNGGSGAHHICSFSTIQQAYLELAFALGF